MKKVKMHSGCIGQEKVVTHQETPPAPSCRCKKLVDFVKANELVKTGQASWVIVAKKPVEVEVDCSFCLGWRDSVNEAGKKSCSNCGGTGKVKEVKEIPTYNNDIVLLSSISVDPKNKKYRWNTRQKTPRVATIEAKHINRAFVDNLIYAVQRIEEYERMIQEELGEFGAQLRDGKTGEIVLIEAKNHYTGESKILGGGNPEPGNTRKSYPPGSITFKDGSKNKNWWWEIEGREYDFGRVI